MKKEISNRKAALIITWIVFTIIFFSYNMTMSWDSSEYLGLADFLGTEDMMKYWIGHRGIGFPLLIQIFQFFGIKNQFTLLLLMYLFYLGLIYAVFRIIKKCKEHGLFETKGETISAMLATAFFIVINPIIFGYYHTLLTEFVAITTVMITCFLAWRWTEIDYKKENKEQIIVYALLFTCISIFLYHIKQSLYPTIFASILIAALISVCKNFKFKNIAYRLCIIAVSIVLLATSVKIWGKVMAIPYIEDGEEKSKDVIKEAEIQRVYKKIISGVSNLEEVINKGFINSKYYYQLSDECKQQIQDVLDEKSEYTNFCVYRDNNNEYYAFFSKNDYSIKEQLVFYFEIMTRNPYNIIESYCSQYSQLIFIKDNYPLIYAKENFYIALLTYRNSNNCTGPNESYKMFIEPYSVEQGDNLITKIYDVTYYLRYGIIAFTKINLYILPFILIGLCMDFFRKIRRKKNTKIVEILLILYGTAYCSIMSYVVFGSFTVDRYAIPAFVPTYIADIILVAYIVKLIKQKKSKQ